MPAEVSQEHPSMRHSLRERDVEEEKKRESAPPEREDEERQFVKLVFVN